MIMARSGPWVWVSRWFLLIAEPRPQRVIHFLVYGVLLVAGITVLVVMPPKFESILGHTLVYLFGSFVAGGALLAAVGVLPGWWWVERAGILALTTGLAMYLVITLSLGITLSGFLFFTAFILMFVVRWMDIRLYQLAPKRG